MGSSRIVAIARAAEVGSIAAAADGMANMRHDPRSPCAPVLLVPVILLAGCGEETMLSMMAPRGSVEVTTVTTGATIDPDGYVARITGNTRDEMQNVGANATITVSNLDVGTYVLSLEDVAANCTVANNDRTIAVAADATTGETFNVQC